MSEKVVHVQRKLLRTTKKAINKQTNKNNYKHICVEVKDKEMMGNFRLLYYTAEPTKGEDKKRKTEDEKGINTKKENCFIFK